MSWDVHYWTPVIRTSVNLHQTQVQQVFGTHMNPLLFRHILEDLAQILGVVIQPALQNLGQAYDVARQGIFDSDLPSLNFAVVLYAIWGFLKYDKQVDASTWQHFRETLEQIGSTCRQGITHRLWLDFLVFLTPPEPTSSFLKVSS